MSNNCTSSCSFGLIVYEKLYFGSEISNLHYTKYVWGEFVLKNLYHKKVSRTLKMSYNRTTVRASSCSLVCLFIRRFPELEQKCQTYTIQERFMFGVNLSKKSLIVPKIRLMYSPKWNCAALFPIPTNMYLWAIFIFQGSVCLFVCGKTDIYIGFSPAIHLKCTDVLGIPWSPWSAD